MDKTNVVIAIFFISLFTFSCSRKHHPAKTIANNSVSISKPDSISAKKIVKPKPAAPTPKVISVNDNVAHKSVDGRLYYDLLGHRYWKNYKDGKYYLFSQSMYDNDDFKPR
jgi:hypothetical protein